MDNNQDLVFLEKNNNQNLFKQLDEELKTKQQESNATMTNDEFIKSLPNWDMPPLYEKVRRVTRQ